MNRINHIIVKNAYILFILQLIQFDEIPSDSRLIWFSVHIVVTCTKLLKFTGCI
jgi:hypothetical protein